MIKRIWKGDFPFLPTVGVVVLITPIFIWIIWKLGSHLPGPFIIPVLLTLLLVYGIVATVITWRSSSKYKGKKFLSYSVKILICGSWVIFMVFGFVFLYYFRPDFSTNSCTIEEQLKPDPKLPYIGFWKTDCSKNFGIAIQKAAEDSYYFRFCGPGGCFGKSSLTRTKLINDPNYKIIDKDTIGLDLSIVTKNSRDSLKPEEKEMLDKSIQDGMLIFKRCK